LGSFSSNKVFSPAHHAEYKAAPEQINNHGDCENLLCQEKIFSYEKISEPIQTKRGQTKLMALSGI
jgi:hypothetical protein